MSSNIPGLRCRGEKAEGFEVAAALQLAGNVRLADREADPRSAGLGGCRLAEFDCCFDRRNVVIVVADGCEEDGGADAGGDRDARDAKSSRQKGETFGRASKKLRICDDRCEGKKK